MVSEISDDAGFAVPDDMLQEGDTLLLEAFPGFAETHCNSPDFTLTRKIARSAPPRNDQLKDRIRRVAAGAVLVAMCAAVAMRIASLLTASSTAALVLVAMQCVTVDEAFEAIKGRIILAIIAAYGLGQALDKTHIATKTAKLLVLLGGRLGPIGLLFLVYTATALLSNVISNQATVIILYPIVKSVRVDGLTLKQFVMILIIGASSAFMAPTGYQTNLMVWKPGGYAFTDFTKFGAPLTLLVGTTAAVLCYYIV